jgi:hypothetical protein
MKLKDILKTTQESKESKSGLKEEVHESTSSNPWMSKEAQTDVVRKRLLHPSTQESQILDGFKKAVSFTLEKSSLRKGINTFPYLKKGQKGFILHERALGFLPEELRKKWIHHLEEFPENRLFFFHNVEFNHPWITILPLEYLR